MCLYNDTVSFWWKQLFIYKFFSNCCKQFSFIHGFCFEDKTTPAHNHAVHSMWDFIVLSLIRFCMIELEYIDWLTHGKLTEVCRNIDLSETDLLSHHLVNKLKLKKKTFIRLRYSINEAFGGKIQLWKNKLSNFEPFRSVSFQMTHLTLQFDWNNN